MIDLLPKIEHWILDRWNEWPLNLEKPDRLSLIVRFSSWLSEAGKVVLIVFREKDSKPCLIAKTVYDSRFKQRIERESVNHFRIWNRLPGNIAHHVSQPISYTQIDGYPIHLERFLHGISLPHLARRHWTKSSRAGILADSVLRAGELLLNFENAMGIKYIKLSSTDLRKWFISPIQFFRSRSRLSIRELDEICRMEEEIKSWEGKAFPMVATHGDFWGGSLLVDGNRVRIIDFEFFEPEFLPLFDIFMLLVHPGVTLTRDGRALAGEFSNCFIDNDFTSSGLKVLTGMAEKIGIPNRAIRTLFPLFLIHMSNSRDHIHFQSHLDMRSSWKSCFRYYTEHQGEIRILP